MAPLADEGYRSQRRSGDHGRNRIQDSENALVDKNRTNAGSFGGTGSATRSRTGAFRPSRIRATNRNPGRAAVLGPPRVRVDAGVAGRAQLRRVYARGNQVSSQLPQSRVSTPRSSPFPVLRTITAPTGGLRSRTGALLVVSRERRDSGRNTPRAGIREAAGRGRGRVLATGEGKPLARNGQRGTESERRS